MNSKDHNEEMARLLLSQAAGYLNLFISIERLRLESDENEKDCLRKAIKLFEEIRKFLREDI